MKRLVCKNCGVVNEVSEEDIEDNDDWLQCALPTGFEWILPAGKDNSYCWRSDIYLRQRGASIT